MKLEIASLTKPDIDPDKSPRMLKQDHPLGPLFLLVELGLLALQYLRYGIIDSHLNLPES